MENIFQKKKLYNSYKPIFIQGMMGGGTGIIWNLIQSHPFCSGMPLETNEALSFRFCDLLKAFYRKKIIFFINFFKILLLSKKYRISPMIFKEFKRGFEIQNINKIYDRRIIMAIDEHLYNYKMMKIKDPIDKYKYPGTEYTVQELKNTRLVAKNIENLCFFSDWFQNIYPTSKFVSIVRNPYAVCESQLRHKRSPSVVEVSIRCNRILQAMINQNIRQPDNFFIIKYEDLVLKPINSTKLIYKFLDLDFDELRGFSIHIRNFLGKKMSFMQEKVTGRKYWIRIDELEAFFQPNINERSMRRLSEKEVTKINENCGSIMEFLKYGKI